jgi:hypothetical protein
VCRAGNQIPQGRSEFDKDDLTCTPVDAHPARASVPYATLRGSRKYRDHMLREAKPLAIIFQMMEDASIDIRLSVR